MSLLEEAYRQRAEFLRRNLGAPDLILVPYDKQFEFIGEVSVKHTPVVDRNTLNVMGMRVLWVESVRKMMVCQSADALTGNKITV